GRPTGDASGGAAGPAPRAPRRPLRESRDAYRSACFSPSYSRSPPRVATTPPQPSAYLAEAERNTRHGAFKSVEDAHHTAPPAATWRESHQGALMNATGCPRYSVKEH